MKKSKNNILFNKIENYYPNSHCNHLKIEWPNTPHGRAREVISRSKHRVTGKYPSWKTKRMMHWESQLERDSFLLHDVFSLVGSYQEQPVRITYECNGVTHVHYPDLLVKTNANKVFKEIKSDEDANQDEVKERTTLLSKVLPIYGFTYELMLESEIRQQPRLINVKKLLRYGRKPVDGLQVENVRRLVNSLNGKIRWGDILETKYNNITLPIVCRLILEGFLNINIHEEWAPETKVIWKK